MNDASVAISDGTTGSFNPATGQLTITSVGSSVNTNAAPIAFSVSGSALSLSWPADHLGWSLQVQTNAAGAGLSNVHCNPSWSAIALIF